MREMEKQAILIVDDRQENLFVLENLLEDLDLNIVKAASGNEALSLMLEYDFALVLLDVQMPEMDGFETAELMRGNKRTRIVPIIFLTALSKEQKHIFKGYEKGAVDYLFKPFDPDILKSKVKIFLELHKQKKTLEKTSNDLKETVAELRKANKKILEQQKAVIEEERLNLLLQMAGAKAYEIDQPLMTILDSIESIKKNKEILKNPDYNRDVSVIEEAGKYIVGIVEKIQKIHNYESKLYFDSTTCYPNLEDRKSVV